MNTIVRSAVAMALIAGGAWFPAQRSVASMTVFGNGLAQACSKAAHEVAKGVVADGKSVDSCNLAIGSESLSLHDLAGSHINRGVLLLSRSEFTGAKEDFDSAAALMPELGEAYTDRGAALIGLRRYAEAIAEIDRGLALSADEPEKAFFNRGLAHEALDDMKSAYGDYLAASRLKPNWQEPRNELSRFTVAQAK